MEREAAYYARVFGIVADRLSDAIPNIVLLRSIAYGHTVLSVRMALFGAHDRLLLMLRSNLGSPGDTNSGSSRNKGYFYGYYDQARPTANCLVATAA